MAEVYRKGTLGSMLARRAASLLWIRLLFVFKPPLWERERGQPVGAWLKKYTYSLLMELFPRTWLQEYSTMPRVLGILRNILYPIWCSVGNSTHVEFSKSCRILKILSNSQNPIEFSKILSNILYPIEYSYGSSEDSTIYLTVSIAYSIYSTSH